MVHGVLVCVSLLYLASAIIVEAQKTIACEFNDLIIKCGDGQLINVIQANYGRLSKDICTEGVGSKDSTNCRSKTSLQVLKDKCNVQRSCKVAATNGNFGDPCPGVLKYLEVEYACQEAQYTITCEHNDLDIQCEYGQVINVLEANYGRSSINICREGPGISASSVNCRSQTSLQVLKNRCNGEKSCIVAASNGNFGDPCAGTYKYLEAEYFCTKE